MKLLLFISIIYINHILCENSHILLKTVSKKLKPFGKLHIINSGKYGKSAKIKKPNADKEYTAFPQVVSNEKRVNVPDSPYFPLDQHYDQKPRVKKVLPEYEWTSLRSKRSVSGKIGEHEIINKDVKQVVKNLSKKFYERKTVNRDGNNIPANKGQSNKKKNRGKKTKLQDTRVRNGKNRNKTRLSRLRNSERQNRLKYTKKPAKRSSKKRNKNNLRKLKKPRQTGGVHEGKRLKHGTLRDKKSSKVLEKKPRKVEARRLIAGRDALIEDYPYVVSIQKGREHWCAGALLNPRLVITTANCLWKSSHVSRLRIRAGSRYQDRGGQEAKIQEVMKHPAWGIRRSPDNDVALVLLDRNIRFSDSVHGVDLPNRVMMPPFDDAWITSWGAERRDGVYDSTGTTLQVYHARLMDRAKCNNVTQRFGVSVTDNFICLAQTGRRAPCTRDTGAPAVSDGVLWGLASWGIRKLCGTERFPAMFSYLASQTNLDFIANATRLLMADERHYPFADRYPIIRASTTTTTPSISPF